MPPRSSLPGSVPPSKFIRALRRLGYETSTKGGRGSHIKAIWPKNNKSVTIPQRLDRDVLAYIIPEITKCSQHTWEEIEEKL